MTICTKCLHFFHLDPGTPRADCGYNHRCLAKRLPVAMRPYDGKRMPYRVNDRGEKCFTDNGFEFCGAVNKGNCTLFDPSSRLAAVESRGAQ